MKKMKINRLMSLGLSLVLLCTIDVSASLYFFTGAIDQDVSVPGNWEIGTSTWKVPGDGTAALSIFAKSDSIYIGGKTGEHHLAQGNPKGAIGPDTLTATLYAGRSEQAGPAIVGSGANQPEDGIVNVYGTLTATGLTLGEHGAENGNWVNGIVNVHDGGVVDVQGNMTIGRYGWGSLNIFDGGRVIAAATTMGLNNGQGGEINLNGGVFQTGDLTIIDSGGTNNGTWILSIQHGELKVKQNVIARIQEYIDAGKIRFSEDLDPGWYFIYDYDITNPGYTTVKAIRDKLERIPLDKSTVNWKTDQLQWTLPEPNDPVTPSVVTCDVYFGTEPNALLLPKTISKQSVESASVTLALDTVYYWFIDVYDSKINASQPYYRSPVFTFNTNNVPPIVDAGADQQTWLAGTSRVVQLNGSAFHFHNLPLTHNWTVLSEPDPLNPAVISNPAIVNPTVTLNAAGTYSLQLESTEGVLIGKDTVQVVVYSDACEYASNQPGFEWIVGDVNNDCAVDIGDIGVLAAQWLDEYFSVE